MSPTLQKNDLKTLLKKQDTGFLAADKALTAAAAKGFSLPYFFVGGRVLV